MRACLTRFGQESYDTTTGPLSLKVRMPKAEVIETLVYGCVAWTLVAEQIAKLRTAHRQVLLRVIGVQCRLRADRTTLSYAKALKVTRCESIDTTIRKRRLLLAGAATRQNTGQSPSRVMSGTMAGGTSRTVQDSA